MSYDGRILRRALARYDEDRQRREENFRERERAVYRKEPRIEQINIELSHTMAKIIASGLKRGTDPRPAIHALQEENLRLQAERAGLLQGMGYPADYLEQKPNCSRSMTPALTAARCARVCAGIMCARRTRSCCSCSTSERRALRPSILTITPRFPILNRESRRA